MLAYAETWHTGNLGISEPFHLHSDTYSGPCHIYENLQTLRPLTYLKPNTYSQPSQKIKTQVFAKIVKNCNVFPRHSILNF